MPGLHTTKRCRQSVNLKLNGSMSSILEMRMDIPQGCILGPNLFFYCFY
jgi:hypothetical protein